MPTTFSSILNSILVGLPSATYDASLSPVVFDTNQVTRAAFDVTVTSFTGGTSPSIQFVIERLGLADGLWYSVLSTTISSASNQSWDLGPGFPATAPPNGVSHAVFTTQGRLRWAFGGTVAPTAVTFSASLIGR
ncbi:MAG TPA: hypothetical protein VIY48_17630 [Candidatus Paceibacterota bacterium]